MAHNVKHYKCGECGTDCVGACAAKWCDKCAPIMREQRKRESDAKHRTAMNWGRGELNGRESRPCASDECENILPANIHRSRKYCSFDCREESARVRASQQWYAKRGIVNDGKSLKHRKHGADPKKIAQKILALVSYHPWTNYIDLQQMPVERMARAVRDRA